MHGRLIENKTRLILTASTKEDIDKLKDIMSDVCYKMHGTVKIDDGESISFDSKRRG